MALDETTLPFFDTDLSDTEAASPTAHLLETLQLYGYRPFEDEPDPRPLPEPQTAQGLLYDSFDAIIAHAGRYAPRGRLARCALVDGQPVPPSS